MKVTGYQLREALSRWVLRRDSAASRFKDTLHVFAGEDKPSPGVISAQIAQAEASIAALQTWQANYNLRVHVEVPTLDSAQAQSIPLLEAVKRMGGLARVEKMWREASVIKRDKFLYRSEDPLTRDKDHEKATRTVSFDDAAKIAEVCARTMSHLREAIAIGNASELTLEGFPVSLLE